MTLTDDDSRRLKFVLATMGLTLAGSIVSAVFRLGCPGAMVLNIGTDALILWHIVRYKDGLLGRLFLFGAVAGIFELLTADPWAVAHGGLIYSPCPRIVDSPVYMPLGWIYVILQIGYLAIWFARRWGLAKSTLLCGVIGGINIPTYESLAYYANWWVYDEAVRIHFHTPDYVILGEVLIGLALPLLVVRLPRLKTWWAVPLGIAAGVWTWVAAIIAFQLVGR